MDVSDGYHRIRLRGMLSPAGLPKTPVTVTRAFAATGVLPVVGTEFPAVVDRSDPRSYRIRWPGGGSMTDVMNERAAAEHAERARALGLDPGVLPAPPQYERFRDAAAAATAWAAGGIAPLPDGTAPVDVGEAARLISTGEPATALIVAIDYLDVPARTLPTHDATLANVALDVTRADSTTYPALARFGFRTAARRQQIGHVGAVVPVRLDPERPGRVALDSPRLPPLPE
jgi:hypothetical protein